MSKTTSRKMEVAMTEVSMERCPLDVPYEILFEIFRRLPKGKLVEMSKLCAKFKNVAEDARLWKNVCIKYEQKCVAFEELYSEPRPVKTVDLLQTEIKPPVLSKTDEVVKVTELYMSFIKANTVTMEAILAKYQCTELYLDFNDADLGNHIMEFAPEVISKQTALEVLNLRYIDHDKVETEPITFVHRLELAPDFSNCKYLKSLYLTDIMFVDHAMMSLVRNLPKSLEKFFPGWIVCPQDPFFELLAERTPNLREIEFFELSMVKCQHLLKFRILEVLHTYYSRHYYQYISHVFTYLIRFPALKTICVAVVSKIANDPDTKLRDILTKFEPHHGIARLVRCGRSKMPQYPEYGDLWTISKVT